MATIVQVASLAGVSTSTVSHVLNNTRPVEPETRQRVVDAIEKTGYRQDALARALRRSRTDSIGLVIPDAGEPAFAEMVHGVEKAAADAGLTLVLANSAEDAEREYRAVNTLLDRRVDGLILARAAESLPGLTGILQSEKRPIVLLDRLSSDLPFDQIAADNRESMRQLATHLAKAGHQRFAVLVGDDRVSALRERREGFQDAASGGGIDPALQFVIVGRDDAASRQSLDAALGDVTCVIACSTPLAVLALETVRARGLEIPRDIAFATFDGFAHGDLFEPRLTTVRQPAFEMGIAAVELLSQRMVAPDAGSRTVRLQQRIELRPSTEDFAAEAPAS